MDPLRPQSHEYLHSTESATTVSHYDQRIRALTSILDRQPCQPPISNIDPLDVESNVELRSYYYLATLLTTGLYDHNCAVTAILSPGLVKCIIADTGDLRHERGSLERRVHAIPEGQTDLQTLGSQPSDPEAVNFETHAADVFHALRTYRASISTCETSPYWLFLRFIVRRCYMKIAERMQNGVRIWRTHPMAILRDWTPPDDANAFPREEFSMRNQVLEASLSFHGIKPIAQAPGERSTYCFDTGNAHAWAQTACSLYEVLEKRLFTPYVDGTGPVREMPRASMDSESVTIVADYLDTLAVILDLPPMKAIFFHASFISLLEPRSASHPSAETNANFRDESEGEHVYRYLRAVVSWVTATLSLTQHEIFKYEVPVELYHVHIPPEPTHDLSALRGVREDVLPRLSEDDERRARHFLDTQERKAIKFHEPVHPESALMGILVDKTAKHKIPGFDAIFNFYDGRVHTDVRTIFQQGYVTIGGTHNCCFCCWWLADALTKSADLEFVLTGTHGLVRPWAAPHFGMSSALLRDLDADMIKALLHAVTHGRVGADHHEKSGQAMTAMRSFWTCAGLC